jgi:DNA-binding transcriptional MerR regulator
MYTIGQFSRICQVSPKALRHYEKLGLLIPSRVDENNQYRYYTREQLDSIKAITFLKDLGIPLKTIITIVKKGSQPKEIEAILEEHRVLLLEQLNTLNHRLVRLGWWRKSTEAREMNEVKNYDVRLRDVPEIMVYSERRVMKDIHHELPQLLRRLLDELNAKGVICAGAPILMYYDNFYDGSFDPNNVDVEVGWPVNDPTVATNKLPAVRAAGLTYVGPYDGLEDAYAAVFTWLNENGCQGSFPTREISINDPAVTPPEQLVTDILIPLAPAK